MPLVRVEVTSEYALGEPELYRLANKEDPKEILEGVAVSALVGLLRQLGDLVEFAAEVFHGLQDDATRTSSRSHKLMARVRHIESAVAPLEKAVLAQRSHLHFAYTSGSNWHAHIQCEENHFLCSDVPQFIMDAYEGCRGCPHLHLLDRFDPGGPGSCLKRYSDRTLFKRASIASDEASTENISKDKQSRKTKKLKQKRRSNPRIREVSRGASFFNHGGRTQFTQLDVGGNSSSQTTCSKEDILRSDMAEKSNLHLRNGSGYIESDVCSNNSIQHEELKSRESISSPGKRHDSNLLHHNSLEHKTTDTYDGFQISPRDQPTYNSSYDTWDGKTYTVEPTTQKYDSSGTTKEFDHDRNTVSCSSKLNFETWGVNEVNMEIVDKNDVMPCDEAVPTLESDDILVEDIDSEADQFMDALNSIESEFETDTNCVTKKEGCYTDLDDIGADDRVSDLISSNLEDQSLVSGSNLLANGSTITAGFEQDPTLESPKSPSTAYSPINGGTVITEPTDDKKLQPALRTGESLNRGGLQKVDPLEKVDIDNGAVERCVSNTIVSDCRDDPSGLPITDRGRCSPESWKPAPETSNVTSVMIWTNGGLLGLKPSKPPDYSLGNALPQDPLYRKYEENRKTSCKISPADNTENSTYQSNDSSTVASAAASRSLLPGNLEYQVPRNQQDDSTSSSRIFEFSSRLFTVGANGKPLHDRNEITSPASYTGVFEQKNNQKVAHQTFSGPCKDLIGGEPSVLSPSASPPLEHMKISFQPIDGFETSKLKLKFPNRNCNNESNRCIFPSFQLVPEVSGTLQNDGSDSDDDTFYRSSPSLEDGCIGPQSESNSDRWESGESPCCKDPDFHDSFHQISLTESISTVSGAGRKIHGDHLETCKPQSPFVENGVQNSNSQHSFDLHSSDIQYCSFKEELTKNSNTQNPLGPQFMISPGTPPLPPAQWRGMKPNQNAMDNYSEALRKASKYAFDLKLSGSTVSQQPKPAPLNQNDTFESSNVQNSKQSGLNVSDVKEEDNRQKGGIDKKEDFLQQIRTRSFSLRPTVATKPYVQSVGHANLKVTAMLRKANAVRQAVGSDDDGNWSDP